MNFFTLKKLDYSAKDRYILYRIKGLIKTFLKTVIQPEKKILNKDLIFSNFNNMIFNPITEELLLAHLLHYLNSYNNNNEYDLNFIINCKMDNKTVKQSKFKHLIDIFTPKETDNIELEKIKIMNVNEKYKYFYITKGNTYDKTKKTPEKLNELQFKLLISMSNNQINEYLQYLEKRNTNRSDILKNFNSFMSKDTTIDLFSRLYNKTLVGGNQGQPAANDTLDIVYSHVFFNTTQNYVGQNINDVLVTSTKPQKLYTIGNSGHLYGIHKPKGTTEYSETYEFANKEKYLKYNFISMHICKNFIFILANDIQNKQYIIHKDITAGSFPDNPTEIPVPTELTNIKYNYIYVDDVDDTTPVNANNFNIYLTSDNCIFKLKMGDLVNTTFIYNNKYNFKNNFIKIKKKNYCVIHSTTSLVNEKNTKNVTFLSVDPDANVPFKSDNINN